MAANPTGEKLDMQTSAKNEIAKLQNVLASVDTFRTTIYVESFDGRIKEAQVTCDKRGKYVRSYLLESPGCILNKHQGGDTLVEAFTILTSWLAGATIYPETVTVIDQATVAPTEPLYKLTKSSWCEAFDWVVCDLDNTTNPEQTRTRIFKEKLWSYLTGGPAGVKLWNDTPIGGLSRIDWSGSQLSGAKLRGALLTGLNFNCADFDGADLTGCKMLRTTLTNATVSGAKLDKADFSSARAESADFSGSSMKMANLSNATLKKCMFKHANLSQADLRDSQLQGADFSTANLTAARFDGAHYNENTSLPAEFLLWSKLLWTGLWRGTGPDPFLESLDKALFTTGVADFDQFCHHLKALPFHGSSLNNAFQMLRQERFQLFAQVKDQLVTGVVKSQSNPDLAYSCSLASDGAYCCITQNLRQCGGLQGGICKHILLLVIGLARSEKLDLTKATKWILESVGKKSFLDKEKMTEVFLQYKKAESGKVDWRPTETIPEDYYAF